MTDDVLNLSDYIINLALANERMKPLEENLQKLKLLFTRIETVPGSSLAETIRGFHRKEIL